MLSMDRDEKGNEAPSDIELARLAVPRRVYSMARVEYAGDRIGRLFKRRDMEQGMTFIEELPVLRFFFGRLETLENRGDALTDTFERDFGSDFSPELFATEVDPGAQGRSVRNLLPARAFHSRDVAPGHGLRLGPPLRTCWGKNGGSG